MFPSNLSLSLFLAIIHFVPEIQSENRTSSQGGNKDFRQTNNNVAPTSASSYDQTLFRQTYYPSSSGNSASASAGSVSGNLYYETASSGNGDQGNTKQGLPPSLGLPGVPSQNIQFPNQPPSNPPLLGSPQGLQLPNGPPNPSPFGSQSNIQFPNPSPTALGPPGPSQNSPFGNGQPSNLPFGGSLGSPQNSQFGNNPSPQLGGFGAQQNSPFGNGPPNNLPFGGSLGSPQNSQFGNNPSPLGSLGAQQNSPFTNVQPNNFSPAGLQSGLQNPQFGNNPSPQLGAFGAPQQNSPFGNGPSNNPPPFGGPSSQQQSSLFANGQFNNNNNRPSAGYSPNFPFGNAPSSLGPPGPQQNLQFANGRPPTPPAPPFGNGSPLSLVSAGSSQYPSYTNGLPPPRPPSSFSNAAAFSSGQSYTSSFQSSPPQYFRPNNSPPPGIPSGSLEYLPQLSPYHQNYIPSILQHPPTSDSGGWRPGKPPSSEFSVEYLPGKPPSSDYSPPSYFPGKPPSSDYPSPSYYPGKPPSSGSLPPGYFPGGSSASASAIGFGSAIASAATSSFPGDFGWKPPPPPPSGPPPTFPIPTNEPDIDPIFGWGPQRPPSRPPRPPPEFSYQFSLKPSSFGWETSYNVPCGNYRIQPRVVAHLRLATQAVLPKKDSPDFPPDDKRRRKRQQDGDLPPVSAFIDPIRLEKSLQKYNPYQSHAITRPRPSFRPRTCRWNFNAVDGCKLNFKCSWFQLPALFQCDENKLHLSDNTILLDKTFCGNRRPRSDDIFSSSSGRLAVSFKSKGAALPAILDCTVLCTPADDSFGPLKPSPTPTDFVPTFDPAASVIPGSDRPTNLPSFPIIAQQPGLLTSASQTKEQRKNVTLIIKQQQPSSSSQQQQMKQTQQTQVTPSKPQLRMGNCRCGVPDSHLSSKLVHGRIVGGSTMMPGESPWTAALVKKNSNRPYCGAVLLNSQHLLTAAHCVSQARKTRQTHNGTLTTNPRDQIYFDVLLNEHDISQPNEIAGGTIRAKVDRVIVHPNYYNVTFHFDAALIRLAEPIEFNSWTERKIPLVQIYQNFGLNSTNDTSSSSTSNASKIIAEKADSGKHGAISNVHRLFYNSFDFHSLRKKRFLIPEIEARAIPPKPVPICLPEAREESSQERSGKATNAEDLDDYGVVTGWGLVTEGGTPSTEMLKARVQIFNDSTCQELYKKHNYLITDSMMCAGYINGRIDSCVGDSGSPLAKEDRGRFVLTALVSWGRGCGRKQLPGVYTKVSELMDWIYKEASTDEAVWCE